MQDRIEYETLVQKALRNVIRDVLADVAKNGLPGEHHFYITFSTQKADVQISDRLKERFPETMTIVLQHRFWDMQLFDDSFTVTLSFGGVSEKLLIPFSAMQIFYDPAAAFEVAFNTGADNTDSEPAEKAPEAADGIVAFPPQHRGGEKSMTEKTAETLLPNLQIPQNFIDALTGRSNHNPDEAKTEQNSNSEKPQPDEKEKRPENSASIVSLDAFRKK